MKNDLNVGPYFKIVDCLGCDAQTFVPEEPLDNIKPTEPNPVICPNCHEAIRQYKFRKTLTFLE